jgi:hypothetical protein
MVQYGLVDPVLRYFGSQRPSDLRHAARIFSSRSRGACECERLKSKRRRSILLTANDSRQPEVV